MCLFTGSWEGFGCEDIYDRKVPLVTMIEKL